MSAAALHFSRHVIRAVGGEVVGNTSHHLNSIWSTPIYKSDVQKDFDGFLGRGVQI